MAYLNDLQPVVDVEIDALSTAGSPRSSGESLEHVEMLAAAQAPLPPIIVHRPTMRVIDGMHRVRVAILRGQRHIAVRFFDGTEKDAFVLAVRMNIAHGLPLSLADRKRAATRIVGSHPAWSDRMIGSVAGVSARTVAELRRHLGPGHGQQLVRIGRDGRVRSIDGSAGRRLAYELITRDPGLSLRQVARAAGISPETARDVRNRMHRGQGPLPDGRAKDLVTAGPPARLTPGGRRLGLVTGHTAARRAPAQPAAAMVERLKADPALRLNENGRDLLRLLNIHTIGEDDWDKIMESVPPHCRGIVAQLARECAQSWTEFAHRVERTAPKAT